MAELRHTTCCGLKEAIGLEEFKNPVEFLAFIAKTLSGMSGAFIILSCRAENELGKKLIRFITKQKLGTITETELQLIPKTSHYVRAIVWGIDHDALFAWAAESVPEIIAPGRVVRATESMRIWDKSYSESWRATVVSVNYKHMTATVRVHGSEREYEVAYPVQFEVVINEPNI